MSFEKLIGIDTLWRVSIECENEKSREEAMELLVDLHLKFDQVVSYEDQVKIWTNFTENCMNNLESEKDNVISNTIQLLSRFLDRYEGKKVLKTDIMKSGYSNIQPLQITVLNKNDSLRKAIQVSYF